MKYTIYSHADSDGGIAAAMLGRHIENSYSRFGWNVDVVPVNYSASKGDWWTRDIQWPCAILDFALHPRLLDQRFFQTRNDFIAREKFRADQIPPCYWIDHHPTGSSFSFLTAENTKALMPDIVTKWDTTATSTPGLLRKHFAEIGLERQLIEEFELLIDLAEIIDGALYATVEASHDFSSPAIKLQTLFNPSHEIIDKSAIYRAVVKFLKKNPNVGDLFDADPLFLAIIQHERELHARRVRAYQSACIKKENIAIAVFKESKPFEGMGRFLPFLLFPDVDYAIHVTPPYKNMCAISCGINPWNKPRDGKHLGHYFAKHFDGGGHSFVAGGKLSPERLHLVDDLVEFLTKTLPVP